MRATWLPIPDSHRRNGVETSRSIPSGIENSSATPNMLRISPVASKPDRWPDCLSGDQWRPVGLYPGRGLRAISCSSSISPAPVVEWTAPFGSGDRRDCAVAGFAPQAMTGADSASAPASTPSAPRSPERGPPYGSMISEASTSIMPRVRMILRCRDHRQRQEGQFQETARRACRRAISPGAQRDQVSRTVS